MIDVRMTVKGEPDTSPFIRTFFYLDKTDEQIFYNSVEMIKKKIYGNLKINVNESLIIFCAYVVSELRKRKSTNTIERNSKDILSLENVMIGVSETLRDITIEATVDNLAKRRLAFSQPIRSTCYSDLELLTSHSEKLSNN
jgi:urease gamma subunit